MNIIEHEKNKLSLLEKKRAELLTNFIEDYELDSDNYESSESVYEGYICGDIELEWFDNRDLDYLTQMVSSQNHLMYLLEQLDTEDKKALHNINKGFEIVVSEARQIKQKRLKDIEKAQEVITLMDEIIQTCDKYRKQTK